MAAVAGQPKKSALGGTGQVKTEREMSDEEQLELNMRRLNLLHVKCRELRTTLQQMLEASESKATGGEEVYQSFFKSVLVADNQIKDFGTLYNSEESKRVLEQAKKSRDANPKGIKPWRAKDHPDWLDLDQ